MEQNQPYQSLAHRHQHSVENIVTLFEWLLVAFILALLFQGFAVQAFQIPTGSMADTLRGAHYHLRCQQCGYAFDIGSDTAGFLPPRCPICNCSQPPQTADNMKNGDRIFVLKSIYQFFEPKRWDVVVFKNPINPKDNYIKRLIALPNETVQLINGDVFINGQIARKPAGVQKELWTPIFLQDNPPLVNNDDPMCPLNKPSPLPFQNEPNSTWQLQRAFFSLEDTSGQLHTINFVPNDPSCFRAGCAYNDGWDKESKPIVSDLMITFYAQHEASGGCIGASLEKYNVLYSARIEFGGVMVLTKTVNDTTKDLRLPMLIGPIAPGRYEKFEFACVDQLLVLQWGSRRLTYDLSAGPDFSPQPASSETPPRVQIFAAGPVQIRHVGLFRDIFYMGKEGYSLRATDEIPFVLGREQYFVCGDNTGNSLDGRLWSNEGIGNRGRTYDAGVVPRDYLMGKAILVYWSQAFSPADNLPPIIPNLDTIKAIFGGSEQLY